MQRVHFGKFLDIVRKAYRGNESGPKRELSAQLREAKITGMAFADFLNDVRDYAQQSANAEGLSFSWKDADINLEESFAAGKGDAVKAAACHFYFLCHPQYATRATVLNRYIDLAKLMNVDFEPPHCGFGFPPNGLDDLSFRASTPRPTAPFEWPPYISEEVAFAEDAHEGIWLNPHNHHNIPLSGRDEEKKLLTAFLNSEHRFLVAALIAPSGAGKTRLVSEWMKPLLASQPGSTWDAGLVNSRNDAEWEEWSPGRDTLIVIDYPYNYGRVMETILGRSRSYSPYRVRLLVIDHVLPNKLHTDLFWKNWSNERGVIDSKKSVLFEPFPIVLRPLSNDSEMIKDIIVAAADPYTREKRYNRRSDIIIRAAEAFMNIGKEYRARLGEDVVRWRDSARHPLFAALTGQAIYRDPSRGFTNWTRRDLITHYFEHGRRIPWDTEDERNEFAETLGSWVGCYVAAATLLQSVDAREMQKLLPDAARQQLSRKNHLAKLVELCNRITASDGGHTLKPFTPDILGETFFLKFIERYESDDEVFGSFVRMISTFRSNVEEEIGANMFRGTIQRLVRNLLNDDLESDDVRMAWYWLVAFLEPSRFPEHGLIRATVSVAIADIVFGSEAQLSVELTSRLLGNLSPTDLISTCIERFWEPLFVSLVRISAWCEADRYAGSVIGSGLSRIISAYKSDARASWDIIRILSELNAAEVFRAARESFGEGFVVDSQAGGLLLRQVCARGDAEIVRGLIEMGARPFRMHFEDDNLPIHVACEHGNLAAIKILYSYGVNLSPRDYVYYYRYTPLMLACHHGHKELVTWLIANGADVHGYRPSDRKNLLMVAATCGDIHTVCVVLESGVDPNGATTNNVTALMFASLYGHRDIVEILLSHGADPSIVSSDGRDAASGARFGGHDELAALLSSYKAGRSV